MNTVSLFYSYSRADEPFKIKLGEHLAVLRRENIIREWHDNMILPGEKWDETIKKKLEEADIIMLLVSSSFLASDYINDVEIKKAIERHNKNEVIIIPVICRVCDWENSILGKFQALPKNAKPINLWHDEDAAHNNIVKELRRIIKSKSSKSEDVKPVKTSIYRAIPTLPTVVAILFLVIVGCFIVYKCPDDSPEKNPTVIIKRIRDDFNLKKHNDDLLNSILIEIEKTTDSSKHYSLTASLQKEYVYIVNDIFDRITYSLKNIQKGKEIDKNTIYIRYYLKILNSICLNIQICNQDDLKILRELKSSYGI